MEYTVETLAHGTKVRINEAHRFGTDAFLLSDFRQVKYAQKAMDIGSGCGIIPLRWADNGHIGECVAVEIEPSGTFLLNESIRLNGLKNITAVNADIRAAELGSGFDVIACNPPYFTSGLQKKDRLKAGFRHQNTLNEDDVSRAAWKLLKDGGKLVMCQRPERLARVIWAMKSHRIEPKLLRFVRQRRDSEKPWLMLIDGRKNGGTGLTVMNDLVIEDENGGFSEELLRIYGKLKD